MYSMQASQASFQTDLKIPFHSTIRYRIVTKNRPNLLYRYELADISDDLWAAAVNRHQTNVDFCVGDVVFSAHQIVVGQRSSFWREQFDLTDQEGAKRFQIDVDPKIFRQALHFIYTGRLEMAPNRKLLKLAEKYRLQTLVDVCRYATQQLEEIDQMDMEDTNLS